MEVIDKDKAYQIDPINRTVTNNGAKNSLVQGDNNSERFSFTCPRYIEGYDLTGCNNIIIYFTNKCAKTKRKSKGDFKVTDLISEEETIGFTWLIEGAATKYAGELAFYISFMTEVNGVNEYRWNTFANSDTTILPAPDTIDEDYGSLELSMVRGRTANFGIRLRDAEGEPLRLTEGQEIIFGMATPTRPDDTLLEKKIPAGTGEGYFILSLAPEDTANLNPGNYLYDISLKGQGEFFTIIEANAFTLRQDITKYE